MKTASWPQQGTLLSHMAKHLQNIYISIPFFQTLTSCCRELLHMSFCRGHHDFTAHLTSPASVYSWVLFIYEKCDWKTLRSFLSHTRLMTHSLLSLNRPSPNPFRSLLLDFYTGADVVFGFLCWVGFTEGIS